MKKKMKPGTVNDFFPVQEEYRIFQSQPGEVLARYALAKYCMAIITPPSALAAAYSPLLALSLPLAGGVTGFLFLRKKYGLKGALVPLLCALAGILIGLYILSPILSHARALREAYRGL
jgi:hypothetical protein